MFKYNGKEYKTREDAINNILFEASVIQSSYRKTDQDNIVELIKSHQEIIKELNNKHNAIQKESQQMKEDYIKTESAKITNQEYQFISTGFFIEGTIEKLTDTEMVMKHGQYQYIAYEVLRNNNMIFTKPKTIEVKRRYEAPLQYQIIGIESYYLILKTDNNILLAMSDNKDGVRTYTYSKSVSDKLKHLKDATIPLEEDRTFVSKWLMKNEQRRN